MEDIFAQFRAFHGTASEAEAAPPAVEVQDIVAAAAEEAQAPVEAVPEETPTDEDVIVNGWRRERSTTGRVRWIKWIDGIRRRSGQPQLPQTKREAAANARVASVSASKRRLEHSWLNALTNKVNEYCCSISFYPSLICHNH